MLICQFYLLLNCTWLLILPSRDKFADKINELFLDFPILMDSIVNIAIAYTRRKYGFIYNEKT